MCTIVTVVLIQIWSSTVLLLICMRYLRLTACFDSTYVENWTEFSPSKKSAVSCTRITIFQPKWATYQIRRLIKLTKVRCIIVECMARYSQNNINQEPVNMQCISRVALALLRASCCLRTTTQAPPAHTRNGKRSSNTLSDPPSKHGWKWRVKATTTILFSQYNLIAIRLKFISNSTQLWWWKLPLP